MARHIRKIGIILMATLFFVPHPSTLPNPHLRHWPGPAREPAARAALTGTEGHSHNDYEQARPLTDALDNRFRSVEADIWWRDSRILVSHLGISFVGSLRQLYLDPLQERVSKLGSVYGDGKPFLLWLELKESNPQLTADLHELLSQYPSMLTSFSDDRVEPRAVTVILTGLSDPKKAYVDSHPLRLACRDSDHFSVKDPPADHRWCWYALDWWDYFTWNGHGLMPRSERKRLRSMIGVIHQKGRGVRFFNTPDTSEAWRVGYASGVDLIETDSLPGVRQFLDKVHAGEF